MCRDLVYLFVSYALIEQDGAYVDVIVKVGAIKILQKEFDVCEEA